MKARCVCGCGQRAVQRHHIVYQQELRLRRNTKRWRMMRPRHGGIVRDERNLVWIAFDCHGAHHNRTRVLPLAVLPDSAFEFAEKLMGAGAAYEYLRRRYEGEDVRLDALLSEAA